jgi:nitrite reductase/ring-hydroxylating ferredoxin subunit/alkylhydroperoxidase/carboxymuconolactone decarboxylase family protein YurZ
MSDALDYLLKVRPEAMQSYFGFLREAGRHLDPKVRALISVVTKVDGRTEAGFRQYLNRALEQGATPDEILDALLVTFPTLGLSKIVWAVDILLQMDLPGFRPEQLGREESWHDAAAGSDLDGRNPVRVACDGRELFIFRAPEGIRVYDSRCPHQVTNIPELAADGDRLTCPKHGWKFDLNTGTCVEKGNRPLTMYPSRMEAGRILVFW